MPDPRLPCIIAVAIPILAGTGHAQSTWVIRDAMPPARCRMVWDADRDRLVTFGGIAPHGAPVAETWERVGRAWTRRTPLSNAPGPRTGHALAYDSRRRCVVLFGGYQRLGGPQGDTWEWDGADWLQPAIGPGPAPRQQAAMAFDEARGRIVLFGGGDLAPRNDTWTYDGSSWQQQVAGPPPPAMSRPAMARDPARQQTVLFGGSAAVTARTWLWDGTTWAAPSPILTPPPRENHAMAFDDSRQRVVLYGGIDGNSVRDDTWEWDGSNWSDVSTTNALPRVSPAMAFDRLRQRLVLLGGNAGPFQYRDYRDEWERDATGWRVDRLMSFGRAAYDGARGEIVTLGATGPVQLLSETWVWNGSAWARRSPANAPPPRSDYGLAYDPARQRVVLFGGFDTAPAALGDTWEWDGIDWSAMAPANQPPARGRPALAHDPVRRRTVLFGGRAGATSGGAFADTWEWDGVTWQAITSALGPTHAGPMTFDPVRQRLLMFNGGSFVSPPTWEYDGTTWTALPAGVPWIGSHSSLAFDPLRQRPVLFVGLGWLAGTPPEAWEWTGTGWVRAGLAGQLPGDWGEVVTDTRTQRLTLLLAASQDALKGPFTWAPAEVRVAGTAGLADDYGAGCGPVATGAPLLRPIGGPSLGNDAFAVDLLRAAAGSAAVVTFGPAATALPLAPGCTLLAAPGTLPTVFAATDAGGWATVRIPIPRNVGLRGFTVFSQALVLDGRAPHGFAVSAGLRLKVGD